MSSSESTFTAFAGSTRVARGELAQVLRQVKQKLDVDPELRVLIFDDDSGRQLDFDFRGSLEQVLSRARPPSAEARGPGRPKLGVVSREVSLLPRHWEWLERHPQGISAALRRLVDEARKRAPDEDRARRARAAASQFMWVMAGDLPLFEEASRALFASDEAKFIDMTRFWPADVREHLGELLLEGGAFEAQRKPKPVTKK